METKQRLADAIAKLHQARAEFDDATRPLDFRAVDEKANWSVLDHVRHVSHPGAYPSWIRRMATDRSFTPPSFGGAEGYWTWTRQNALDLIDEQITFAQGLQDWQLTRKAPLGKRHVDAIDLMLGMANHYLNHANDIRRLTGQAVREYETNAGMAVAE